MPRRLLRFLPGIGLVVLAALLRLPLLFGLGTLWSDEAFSRHFALLPLAQSLKYLTMDVHPPMHLIVLHVWIKLFGASTIALRSLSLAFALLGLAAFLKLARAIFGKGEALLAGALFAFSPVMAYYGVDARMYAMLFFLSCASGWLFWRLTEGDERAKEGWMWVSALLALTHLTGALVLIGQALYLLVSRERRPLFRELFWRFLAIAAVFCLWCMPALAYRLQSIHKEWQFRSGQQDAYAALALVDWVWLGLNRFHQILAFIITGSLILAGILKRSDRRPYFELPKRSVFLLCWFAATFAPFLFFPNVTPRYLMAAIPPFFLLLVHGFLKASAGKKYALAMGIGLVILFSFSGLTSQYAERSYTWDTGARWIIDRRQPDDRVVFGWFADRHVIEALDDASLAAKFDDAVGFYPFDDALDPDARYAAHAGTLAFTAKDLDRLTPLFDGAKRVFYVPNSYMVLDGGRADLAITGWIERHGWSVAERLAPAGRTPGVWLLVKK